MKVLSVRVMNSLTVSEVEWRSVSCTSMRSTTRRVQAVKPRAAKKRRKSVFIARLNDEK